MGNKVSFCLTLDFGQGPATIHDSGEFTAAELKLHSEFMNMPFDFTLKKSKRGQGTGTPCGVPVPRTRLMEGARVSRKSCRRERSWLFDRRNLYRKGGQVVGSGRG
jgi:hypothetical protein